MVRGTEDVTTNHYSASIFYKKFSKARKRSLIELHGVDHRYKLLYGKKSATILDEMLVILYSALGINS